MPEADPLIGAIVGDRYKLVEEIGQGGMALVYRAEHQLLHKAVAVKVLHAELSTDETMAARFEGEAIAAARLEHPNVVSITDFGRTPDGRMFLVMEHLEGTPLADVIAAEGRLKWDRAVELIRQTLRGLAHAHDMGVVHRDLKPSNIMVTTGLPGREVAKIIDFGIAKIVSGTMAGPRVETQAGIVFGTADFLAPERLLGQGDSDPRSDLYAIGVILYEALTGERPFHDEDPYKTVQRALKEAVRPPSQIAAEVPAALDAVVARAMARDPSMRYQTAREMLNALDPLSRKPSTGGMLAASARPAAGVDSFGEVAASGSPLAVYSGPDLRPRRKYFIFVGLVAAALLAVALLAGRSETPVSAMVAAPPAPPERKADPEAEIATMVKQAAEGETVADRQRAFDRLVALGYGDRVPWVPMLARDLVQLPTCEERREVVAKMKKINDPAVGQHLQQAAARPENACLAGDVGKAPTAAGAPSARPTTKKRGSRGGGGHF